ncbi:MAG TPA: T9SS type B sorting domain-containing protein [Edaphocola sp.]|nr:T9SS type B sorting domain-containing protein [Edaphocola sp.]
MSIKITPFSFYLNPLFIILGLLLSFPNSGKAQQCCPGAPNLLATYNYDFQTPAPPSGIPPGFINDNNYVVNPTGGGTYLIVESRNYGACSGTNKQWDHTIGGVGGLFLWFDSPFSASVTNPAVAWKPWDPTKPVGTQDLINVAPNTDYVFGAWVRDLGRSTNCTGGGAPLVGLRINGIDVAQLDLGTITTPCCPEWTWFCTTWNSGNNTTALLKIESRRGTGFSDLGIDDVYFGLPMSTGSLLGNDTTICVGDTLLLSSPFTSAINVWNGTDTSNTFPVTSTGTYWLTVYTGMCSISDTIVISMGSPPSFSLGNDTAICQGEQVTLQPNFIPSNGATFLWSDSTSGNSLSTSDPGWVWLDMSNGCGSFRDSVLITVKPKPIVSLPENMSVCLNQGDSISIQAQVQPSGEVYQYLWTPGSFIGNNSKNAVRFSAPPGSYTLKVTITNSEGCQEDRQIIITVLNPASINVNPDFATVNYGDEIQLSASGGISYSWTPETGLNDPNIPNPIARPLENTVYKVVGKNGSGCIDSANVVITLKYPFDIIVPNAFTPNGDGLNDEFNITGAGPWKLVVFNVYNRYGQWIFQTVNKGKGWDGTFNGVPVDQGVYYYFIKIMLPDGEERTFKGDVSLIK